MPEQNNANEPDKIAETELQRVTRQRDAAINGLRMIMEQYGHASDPMCECEDCEYLRPIEQAYLEATQP